MTRRESPPVEPTYCEACRRSQWRGPAMDRVNVPGVGLTLLCVDPTECRRHWPHDAPGVGRAAA